MFDDNCERRTRINQVKEHTQDTHEHETWKYLQEQISRRTRVVWRNVEFCADKILLAWLSVSSRVWKRQNCYQHVLVMYTVSEFVKVIIQTKTTDFYIFLYVHLFLSLTNNYLCGIWKSIVCVSSESRYWISLSCEKFFWDPKWNFLCFFNYPIFPDTGKRKYHGKVWPQSHTFLDKRFIPKKIDKTSLTDLL
jgi:hypothetical protein